MGQATLHQRGQMLHVGHRHDGWLRFGVEKGAPRQQRVVHHIDGHLMFVAVVDVGQQRRRQLRIRRRVAQPWCGAGHGVRSHDIAVAGHQQLGAGAQEPVDVADVAAGVGGGEPTQHRARIELAVGGDDELAGQHDLSQLTVAYAVGGLCHEIHPPRRRPASGHVEAGGQRRFRCHRQLGSIGPPGGVGMRRHDHRPARSVRPAMQLQTRESATGPHRRGRREAPRMPSEAERPDRRPAPYPEGWRRRPMRLRDGGPPRSSPRRRSPPRPSRRLLGR